MQLRDEAKSQHYVAVGSSPHRDALRERIVGLLFDFSEPPLLEHESVSIPLHDLGVVL